MEKEGTKPSGQEDHLGNKDLKIVKGVHENQEMTQNQGEDTSSCKTTARSQSRRMTSFLKRTAKRMQTGLRGGRQRRARVRHALGPKL